MAIHFEGVPDGSQFSARADGGAPVPIAARVGFHSRDTGVDRFGLSNDARHFGWAEAKASVSIPKAASGTAAASSSE